MPFTWEIDPKGLPERRKIIEQLRAMYDAKTIDPFYYHELCNLIDDHGRRMWQLGREAGAIEEREHLLQDLRDKLKAA